jgi:ACGX-repeat protein
VRRRGHRGAPRGSISGLRQATQLRGARRRTLGTQQLFHYRSQNTTLNRPKGVTGSREFCVVEFGEDARTVFGKCILLERGVFMKGLQSFNSWRSSDESSSRTSAQSYLSVGLSAQGGGSCGSSCGSKDEPAKPEPKPTACGSGCGAGDAPKAPEPKPSACGSSCGAGDAPKK